MNKLFNFARAKGEWHKFPSFNLGGGAKLYKNFAQKLLAVSLCMAVVLLGTPVTTFAGGEHSHSTSYSGTKGDDDYCLVCDVATKVNNLYRDSVDEITVENAAKVISQIHAIDQIKFELDDAQYEELIKLTDGWSEGEYGELPSKYFKAKEKINELGLNGGWLAVGKNVLGVGGDWTLDLSEARVSLEVTPVEAAADGTYVAKSDAETMNLDMYGMYDNFSMVLNETTTDFRGQRSFYKRYDVNAGVIDNVNNNGWTTSFLLPAGTYRIREVNREAPMIVDGEEFHTGSTTYTYNGASTTSVVGEDDPGVVVQVAAGAVTPVDLTNMAQGSLTVSCEVASPVAADKERDFTFTVTLADKTINGTYGNMAFTNGVATVTLKGGESKAATGLRAGVGYTVEATDADGFVLTDKTGEAGTIRPEVALVASFTFTRKTGDLTVSCTIDRPLDADKEREFTFTVELDDTSINGTFGDMEFKDGVATFTLKGGESKTATGLPEGVAYTVEATAFDGFTVDSEIIEGTVERGGEHKAEFTFNRETVPVTGVSLSDTTKSLAVGDSFNLIATISPADATNKNVTWTSSDEAVASVSGDGLTGTVKALKAGQTTITVTTADGAKTARCEVTVTEAGGPPDPTPDPAPTPTPDPTPSPNPDAPPADLPADSSYLETTVAVKGKTQRLRVYDPNGVLPDGTLFEALAVTEHEHLDDDHEIEHLLAYDLSLLDASGNPLHMPLDAPVELCFEVLDGLDKDELEVVLVQEFDDAEFEENLVDLDGASWVKVKTNHFSPYVLLDKLTTEEKGVQLQDDPVPSDSSSNSNSGADNNAKTGDQAVQVAVAGLGMTLVLALGIMLRLITNKRKFEE